MKLIPIIIFAFSINLSFAQTKNYDFTGDSEITISGTSNIHDWTASVESFTGSAVIDFDRNRAFEIQSLSLTIPVKKLKSSKGSFMDGKMYTALKSDKYETINYTLLSSTVSERTRDEIWLNTKGELTVSGVTNTISLEVKATIKPNGSILFEGSKVLKIKDFGVEPPTALMGALKTGNEITAEFKATISR